MLAAFADLSLDAVLCVGDVVDGGGDADRCCALLSAAAVSTVRGNHDRWFLEDTMRDPGTLLRRRGAGAFVADLEKRVVYRYTFSGTVLELVGKTRYDLSPGVNAVSATSVTEATSVTNASGFPPSRE